MDIMKYNPAQNPQDKILELWNGLNKSLEARNLSLKDGKEGFFNKYEVFWLNRDSKDKKHFDLVDANGNNKGYVETFVKRPDERPVIFIVGYWIHSS